MTDSFTRAPDEFVQDPISVADPIIRNLDRSGRAGMMEAIATTIADHAPALPAERWTDIAPVMRTSAKWLRIIAARERRS